MRKGYLIPLLLILFIWTTGASIIDKETKNTVLTLDQKMSVLSQTLKEGQDHHAEEIRRLDEVIRLQAEESSLVKEQSELIQKISQRLRMIEQKISEAPQAALVVPPTQPVIQDAASTPVPADPPRPINNRLKNTTSISIIAFLVSAACLFLLLWVAITMRRGEVRLQKMISKTETGSLRGEMVSGRPHLRIQTNPDGISLVNVGEGVADEIKLYLGPTPSNMKQKMKAISRLPAGDKVELSLQSQRSDDLLYATLEYKNSQNGRLYKDQFCLKVDRLTGELIPIQQAI